MPLIAIWKSCMKTIISVINKTSRSKYPFLAPYSNTIANFIKGYYVRNQYKNQLVHIVPFRQGYQWDHAFCQTWLSAYARLDKQPQLTIQKRYFCIARQVSWKAKGISRPIARWRLHYYPKGSKRWQVCLHQPTNRPVYDIHLVDIHAAYSRPIRFAFIFHIGFPLWEMISGGSLEDGIFLTSSRLPFLGFLSLEEELRIESFCQMILAKS